MRDYLAVVLTVKAGDDDDRAQAVTLERLNAWFTDRTLSGFADEPNRPGALLHYAVYHGTFVGAFVSFSARGYTESAPRPRS